MKKPHFRKAFSMITAIVMVVLMSTVAIYVINISASITRETTAQYQREQAMLYAKSYTEYAVMAITANDNNSSSCLSNISGTVGSPDIGNGYKITVSITYIGLHSELTGCGAVLDYSLTPESPLHAIIDVTVQYKEPDHPDTAAAPYITYHKRTLQKI